MYQCNNAHRPLDKSVLHNRHIHQVLAGNHPHRNNSYLGKDLGRNRWFHRNNLNNNLGNPDNNQDEGNPSSHRNMDQEGNRLFPSNMDTAGSRLFHHNRDQAGSRLFHHNNLTALCNHWFLYNMAHMDCLD
jgi:hypothetical protein